MDENYSRDAVTGRILPNSRLLNKNKYSKEDLDEWAVGGWG
jgi:hypothetical protein|tara:strand:+ start:24533 stop:24655 length:123 start_codon:yes stop_codon:yes gene_type:complete